VAACNSANAPDSDRASRPRHAAQTRTWAWNAVQNVQNQDSIVHAKIWGQTAGVALPQRHCPLKTAHQGGIQRNLDGSARVTAVKTLHLDALPASKTLGSGVHEKAVLQADHCCASVRGCQRECSITYASADNQCAPESGARSGRG
jgi:hypothetical protein